MNLNKMITPITCKMIPAIYWTISQFAFSKCPPKKRKVSDLIKSLLLSFNNGISRLQKLIFFYNFFSFFLFKLGNCSLTSFKSLRMGFFLSNFFFAFWLHIHLVLGLCGFELCDSLFMRKLWMVKKILGICVFP